VIEWDKSQGTFPPATDVTGNYGGLYWDCGQMRVWNLDLIAGHEYEFTLTRTGVGVVRMALLLSGGQNGWLGRNDAIWEFAAVSDGTYDPHRYIAAATGTHAVVVFNDLLEPAGPTGDYTARVADLGTPKPDLIVEDISPDSAPSGQPVTLTLRVRNQGSVAAGASQTEVRVDGVVQGSTVATPAVPAGSFVDVTKAIAAQSPGSHQVQATADATGSVDESYEGNNARSETLSFTGPDLVIIGLEPGEGQIGQSVQVEVTVKNQGNQAAGASYTKITLDGVQQGGLIGTPAIGIGASTTVFATLSPLSAGAHQLGACADAAVPDDVDETNELNNCWSRTLQINGPDLVVQYLLPDEVGLATTVVATAKVVNQGTFDAPASQTEFLLDGAIQCASVSTPALGPGEYAYVQCSFGPVTPGVHDLTACADASVPDAVDETDEGNNCTTEDLVAIAPDLVIDHIEPDFGTAGEPITLTVYVRNQGTSRAGYSRTRITAEGMTKCVVPTDPVLPGEVQIVTCAIGSYAGKGISVGALADYTHMVTELDETNNQKDEMVTLFPAVPITVTPNGTGDYATIQEAIDHASDGDVIELTDGVFTGAGNYDLDFGGRAITIRSQSGNPGACAIRPQGGSIDPRRAFHFHSGETGASVVHAIMIFEGYESQGGAILCEGSSPHLSQVRFLNNHATDDGGGVAALAGSSPSLVDCVFELNSAGDDGGGMIAYNGSSPTLTRCRFFTNSAGDRGGGCDFTVNWFGEVTDCHFEENTAVNGGGMCVVYSFGPITGTVFTGNSAQYGGGLQCYGNAQCTVVRCNFYDNRGTVAGAGLYCRNNSSPTLENSIIAFSPVGEAVARYNVDCNPTLACCDVYGNAGGDWVGAIAGQDAGDGNLSTDPLFCDAGERDFELWGESPCAAENAPTCGQIGAFPVGCRHVYTVSPDGTGDFVTIQGAVDSVASHDIIELTDGVFTGPGNHDVDFRGKRITVRSRSGVPEACVVDCDGSGANPRRGFRFHSGEGPESRLEGITIHDGYGDFGGGIYCTGASPSLENLRLSACQASDDGGGICLDDTASASIGSCTFYGNWAADDGGGLFAGHWSSPVVSDCRFEYNSAGDRGGGAAFVVNSFPEVAGCLFRENAGTNGGGLIFVYAYGPVDSCLFEANTASYGGAVQCYGNAQATITRCTMVDNGAVEGGGIFLRNNSSPSIHASIIAFSNDGGAVARYDDTCNPTFSCSDLYGNMGGDWTGFVVSQLPGNDNLSADPMFCDPEGGEYTLHEASPCLAGGNACGELMGCFGAACITTGVPIGAGPVVPRLHPNAPNPFTARTRIDFDLPAGGAVQVGVFDATGRLVRTLLERVELPPGRHGLTWTGHDDFGRRLGAGVYFVRLRTGRETLVQRAILLN
jgi:hypothetical protein